MNLGSQDAPTIDASSLQVLRRSELCAGLSHEEIGRVAAALAPVRVAAGHTICRQNDPGDRMYFIARGRVKVTVERPGGSFLLLEYLGRGAHFGEMSVLTAGPRTATVTALVETDVLELPRAAFDDLLRNVPGFAANLSRALGFRLLRPTQRHSRSPRPQMIALVNTSEPTQRLAGPFAEALWNRGDAVAVLTDRTTKWPIRGAYVVERIVRHDAADKYVDAVRQRMHQMMEHDNRVVLDVSIGGRGQGLPALVDACEEIWWLAESRLREAAFDYLLTLLRAHPHVASRVRLVWLLSHDDRFGPPLPEALAALGVRRQSFKLPGLLSVGELSAAAEAGIARLVRYARGTRIGLALSGGGARGLAHLGVLRGMKAAGIEFDLLAGTSSGALMGVSYAGGWDPGWSLEAFGKALRPPRTMRALPGGKHWYLWSMFRLGEWDRKLRPFLGDARLEDLLVPLSSVSVDLVRGCEVVRDEGDAIHAVLESINLPTIARPIARDGAFLVDGGILNNLPADVLPERGAALVVAVDVNTKLPTRFAGRSAREGRTRRGPGLVETLLRVAEVQTQGVHRLRNATIDCLIAPDTSAFDFADFTRTSELGDVGEAAAVEAAPQLRQMIADLERGA